MAAGMSRWPLQLDQVLTAQWRQEAARAQEMIQSRDVSEGRTLSLAQVDFPYHAETAADHNARAEQDRVSGQAGSPSDGHS